MFSARIHTAIIPVAVAGVAPENAASGRYDLTCVIVFCIVDTVVCYHAVNVDRLTVPYHV